VDVRIFKVLQAKCGCKYADMPPISFKHTAVVESYMGTPNYILVTFPFSENGPNYINQNYSGE